MKSYYSRMVLGAASAALMFLSMGCSSGSSSSGSDPTLPPVPQNGTVSLIVSDAPTEDWATIGVKVLSIALTPQGGGSDVTVYTAPSPAPTINLLQLDQLNEILGMCTFLWAPTQPQPLLSVAIPVMCCSQFRPVPRQVLQPPPVPLFLPAKFRSSAPKATREL